MGICVILRQVKGENLSMFWMIIGYAKTYLDKCARDHIGAYAAQAAYFMIMSAIPFLMVLIAILQLIPATSGMLSLLLIELVPDALKLYVDEVVELVMATSMGAVSISAIVAIWAAGKAFQNLMVGLNVVNRIDETRNWLVTRCLAVIYTFLLLIAIVAIMLLLVFTRQLQEVLHDHYSFVAYAVGLKPVIRWTVVFLFLVLLFTMLFVALPNKKLSFISQLPGGILCAVSWYVFSLLLGVWVNQFGAFSMYGTLATVIIIMFWMYFCMYFMLMCAEANAFFSEAFGNMFKKWMKSASLFH